MTISGHGFLNLAVPRCRFGASDTGFNVVPAMWVSDSEVRCLSPRAQRVACEASIGDGAYRGTGSESESSRRGFLPTRVCLMLNGVDCVPAGTVGDRVFTYEEN